MEQFQKTVVPMQTSLEKQHVQQVYEAIASHFSETRYKPWPLVESHVKSLAPGTLVADVGCGNGKYLGCNPEAFALGSDQSTNLIKICKERGFECLDADGLNLPFQSDRFDQAICIAVVHHYSTRENRLHAIRELKRIVKVGGQVLVTVWAFEQEKKKYQEQDVMIKWHLQKRFEAPAKKTGQQKSKRKGADQSAVQASSSAPTDETVPKEPEPVAEPSQPEQVTPNDSSTAQVLDRYYHLFKQGELDELALEVGGLNIVKSVWDVDNWYLLLERTQ